MVLLGCRFDRHYVEAANVLLTASQTAIRIIFGPARLAALVAEGSADISVEFFYRGDSKVVSIVTSASPSAKPA